LSDRACEWSPGVRFLIVLLAGPPLARLIARRVGE
jgi:hypothetical protein